LCEPQLIPVANDDSERSIYLCGNSLGLQPTYVADYIATYLETWATQGVFGHFKKIEDSPLAPWLDTDDAAAKLMAPMVGASQSEVAVMGSLTSNLHFLMASFYKPDGKRRKIIIEGKAFPSDHVRASDPGVFS
jgi:kynureninase